MQVSNSLQKQVNNKILECQAIIKAKLHKDIKMPTIGYALTGGTAGTACHSKWHIEINAVLLNENQDEMLNDTVPHEYAHLVTGELYPSTKRSLFTKGRPHGKEWQHIMRILGVQPTRCHAMDVSNTKRTKSGSRIIYCVKCNGEYSIGPKRLARLAANPDSMWCGHGCGKAGKLVVKGSASVKKHPPFTLPPVQTITVPKNVTGSKMDVCIALYTANKGQSRSHIIDLFMLQAKCTVAGSNTYYATIKKQLG